ncbi:MAG: NADH-quinone oxidoreductase subunit D [Anaerolinea sp.]|nr:NADH-quinone oxidoreductase subunit D [Anaerolinea sp.]
MSEPTLDAALPYSDLLPGAVLAVEKNIEGESLVVAPDQLTAVAEQLRDHEGYDLLSNLTAVDYLGFTGRSAADRFEIVYHLYSTTKRGGPRVLKVRLPEENPALPTLMSVYPGADLQEREAYDLYGIRFLGHPSLRRILLWEGFNGHPMRKDWQEAYFEAESKPFKSRHPVGHHIWAEDRNPWGSNVNYPDGFDPETWSQPVTLRPLERHSGSNGVSGALKTERIVVNMGPQHPSTHGVFRMIVELDGETVTALEPEMGYLHRNHEKIGERNTYLMNMPYTDRLDYISSMSNNLAYTIAVEKLMGEAYQPTERAEYLRVIMAELTRIVNHLFSVGTFFNDLGAFFTPLLYAVRERELILDLFESVSGSRMMCNYMRFGGVVADLPAGWLETCTKLVHERLPAKLDELERYLIGNEIVQQRCIGVGYLSAADALALSCTGPQLRGSGVPYDIRRAEPYSIYDRFDFDVVSFNGCDVYSRFLVRMEEMRQSVRILQQALKQLPEGPIQAAKALGAYTVRPPVGDVYGRIESPKGELGFYLVSNGAGNPWRYRVRAPSYINLNALAPMVVGNKVADAVIILGAIDIVLGEVDR